MGIYCFVRAGNVADTKQLLPKLAAERSCAGYASALRLAIRLKMGEKKMQRQKSMVQVAGGTHRVPLAT